jgi:hypothetical protein
LNVIAARESLRVHPLNSASVDRASGGLQAGGNLIEPLGGPVELDEVASIKVAWELELLRSEAYYSITKRSG